jgi:hypothetical protein
MRCASLRAIRTDRVALRCRHAGALHDRRTHREIAVAVFVDDMFAELGRMQMCHMIADTEKELHEMADKIGIQRKWYQGDHYDISKGKRELAVKAGAIQITWRQAGCMMYLRRHTGKMGHPDTAEKLMHEHRKATRKNPLPSP